MLITDFVKQSADTAIYPYRGAFGGLTYVICGLAGETGEVFEVLKKIIRDNDAMITNTDRIKSEIGDILWYWSQLLFETNSTFKVEDKTDVDHLQTKLFTEYLGEAERTPLDSPVLIYQQVFLLSQGHMWISKMFENFNKIRQSDDFTEISPIISGYAIEFFKSLCLFLGNLDIKVSEVMQSNLDKLAARKDAGKLQGSGEELDERM